jgi:hypothetical protein
MSSDKNESESTLNGPVLVNGMEEVGRESPGVGVSGNKPMVNGDLRDVGDGGETDFVAVKTPLDGINNSTHEDAAVKQSSSVSMIVSGGSAKTVIGSTSKPRLSSYYSRPQQHRLPPLSYYRYVVPTNHQPTPLFYSPHPQTYLGSGGMQGGGSQLSNTNLYIRGLSEKCCDDDLTRMCQQYGKIVSTKAILDKETNCCKGYGFVDFENPADAMRAVHSLTAAGVMAQFAKVPQVYILVTHTHTHTCTHTQPVVSHLFLRLAHNRKKSVSITLCPNPSPTCICVQQQEQDPTNLYFSNLPKTFDEKVNVMHSHSLVDNSFQEVVRSRPAC